MKRVEILLKEDEVRQAECNVFIRRFHPVPGYSHTSDNALGLALDGVRLTQTHCAFCLHVRISVLACVDAA
jgi:hypothetical protein